jgi:hypothetical protein
MLLFPEPFGPTIAVSPGERGKVTLVFPNDLNPRSSILLMYANFPTRMPFLAPRPFGQPPMTADSSPFVDKNFSV